MPPKKKEHAALGKPLITQKEFTQMTYTANGVIGVIETLRNSLAKLEQQIKADEDGKAEYGRVIERLKIKRAELDKRMKASLEWAEMYDREIGPFQMTYGKNTEGIAVIYDNAKKFHGKGIQMLVDEFDSPPAFKRPTDTFSATPFQPK